MNDLLIWLALLLGAAASLCALYGHYYVLPAWLTGPEVCRLEDGGCAVLFRTPRASLLGVPNALLGVGLYGLLAMGLLLRWAGVGSGVVAPRWDCCFAGRCCGCS